MGLWIYLLDIGKVFCLAYSKFYFLKTLHFITIGQNKIYNKKTNTDRDTGTVTHKIIFKCHF